MRIPPYSTVPHRFAFSLVEVMASLAVLGVMLLVLVSVTDQVQRTYRSTQGKAEQFREARIAFESVTRRLSQATLNTYWDYNDPTNPTEYKRQSELRFVSGRADALLPTSMVATSPTHAVFFQAPLGVVPPASGLGGLEGLLNTVGFYLKFGDDSDLRPSILPASVPLKQRFRLFELLEPSDRVNIYQYTSGTPTYKGYDWFQAPLNATAAPVRPLATNIVALILWPRGLNDAANPDGISLTDDYLYDTSPKTGSSQSIQEHQLPPMIQVTMVGIDEASAIRLAMQHQTSMPPIISTNLFKTSDETNYEEDMAELKSSLTQINHRVFTTKVLLRGARWSR